MRISERLQSLDAGLGPLLGMSPRRGKDYRSHEFARWAPLKSAVVLGICCATLALTWQEAGAETCGFEDCNFRMEADADATCVADRNALENEQTNLTNERAGLQTDRTDLLDEKSRLLAEKERIRNWWEDQLGSDADNPGELRKLARDVKFPEANTKAGDAMGKARGIGDQNVGDIEDEIQQLRADAADLEAQARTACSAGS